MSVRRICVVTGTRADYGLLKPIIDDLRVAPDFELQLVAAAMHLAPEFGLTVAAIEADGVRVDARVDMLLAGDTGRSTAKSMGLGTIGFADAFATLQPDLIIVLGDRFEILAAAQAALVMRIPLAHVAGGDVTEGAFDDAIRHAITKMAALHFATNDVSAARIRAMGENADHVHNVGSPGLDTIRRIPLLDRGSLQTALDWSFRSRNLLITYHPETASAGNGVGAFQALLDALDRLGPDVGLLFTFPNADPGGRVLIDLLRPYAAARANARCFISLGQTRYLSLMAMVDAVVGNSSSGLYEAPSFGIPTVNIGDRQTGRIKAASVIDCAPDPDSIADAIEAALAAGRCDPANPYGDGHATERILATLRSTPDFRALLRKRFFD